MKHNKQSRNFDLNDPFQAGAMYNMIVCCEKCEIDFDFDYNKESIDLNFYQEMGTEIAKNGWNVIFESEDFKFFCPICSKKNNVITNKEFISPTSIESIAQMVGYNE
jgi:hypothetical protein